FRPIIMTSLAFILGVVPLALATGAGAAGRRSIGTGVIGGMLAATFLASVFGPMFYVLIQRLTEYMVGRKVGIDPAAADDDEDDDDGDEETYAADRPVTP